MLGAACSLAAGDARLARSAAAARRLRSVVRPRAEPVAFDREGPGRGAPGRCASSRGWSLSSDDARFGGISAIHVEGGWVTAASDAGSLIRFRIPGTPGAGQVHIGADRPGPGAGHAQVGSRRRGAADRGRRGLGRLRIAAPDLALSIAASWRARSRGARRRDAALAAQLRAPRRWSGSPTAAFSSSRKWRAGARSGPCHAVRRRSGAARHAPRRLSSIARPRAFVRPMRPCCRTVACSSSTGASTGWRGVGAALVGDRPRTIRPARCSRGARSRGSNGR